MQKGILYPIFEKSWIRPGTCNVWFYSDPHFSDPEMIHLRKDYIGDEEQIRLINSKVGRNDTLVILGDVGNIEMVKKLRGYKVLIMGNHDKGASNYKRIVIDETRCPVCGSDQLVGVGCNDGFSLHQTRCNNCGFKGATFGPDFQSKIDNHLFDEVYDGPLTISDRIILSHEPITGLQPYWFNIHGHDHSNWFTGSRHLNCCAEHIGYTPIALTQIVKDGLLAETESIHRITIDGAIERKAKRGK